MGMKIGSVGTCEWTTRDECEDEVHESVRRRESMNGESFIVFSMTRMMVVIVTLANLSSATGVE